MTRIELVEEIERLGREAGASKELEAAAVLKTLAGALRRGTERELMDRVVEHARAEVVRLSAARN